MSAQAPALAIQVAAAPREAFAGQWVPLTLLLKRSEASGSSALIRDLGCRDKDVQLDVDLLQRDVELRPGETYRITIPIRVAHPKVVDLSTILLQLDNGTCALPSIPLRIRSTVLQEVAVRLEAVCAYGDETKVRLTFEHRGATALRQFRVALHPEEAVRAGKRVVRRDSFRPGDLEEVEAVVAARELDIAIAAVVDGQDTGTRLTRTVQRPPELPEQRFRFIEPRRLSSDQKHVRNKSGTSDELVRPVNAAYPLSGDQSYQIEIRPQNPGVKHITLHSVPGVAIVRTSDADPDKRSWKFLVDLSFDQLFSRPERLFYDVDSADGPLKGELYLRLRPPWSKHLHVAGALGGLLTLQGLLALGSFVLRLLSAPEDTLAGFSIWKDYSIFFVGSIPLLWGALVLVDRVQYRLRY
jgi:hypothetical protein